MSLGRSSIEMPRFRYSSQLKDRAPINDMDEPIRQKTAVSKKDQEQRMIELMHGRSLDRKFKPKLVYNMHNQQSDEKDSELSDYSSKVGAITPNLRSIASLSSQRLKTNVYSSKSSFNFEGGSCKTKMMKEKIRANNEMFLLEQSVMKLEL